MVDCAEPPYNISGLFIYWPRVGVRGNRVLAVLSLGRVTDRSTIATANCVHLCLRFTCTCPAGRRGGYTSWDKGFVTRNVSATSEQSMVQYKYRTEHIVIVCREINTLKRYFSPRNPRYGITTKVKMPPQLSYAKCLVQSSCSSILHLFLALSTSPLYPVTIIIS